MKQQQITSLDQLGLFALAMTFIFFGGLCVSSFIAWIAWIESGEVLQGSYGRAFYSLLGATFISAGLTLFLATLARASRKD